MPTLHELQSAFRAAMLGGDASTAEASVRGDGLGVDARLAIYRHHVLTSLTAALETTFPVVRRLVDPRFFRYAADRFVREHPPSAPCLTEYGAALPDFLACFEPSRHLAYLPDVARLEWAMNRALHAPDVGPIVPEALRASPPVMLHPSVTLLSSAWPLDAIWRSNQDGADEAPVDLGAGGVRLQVWRAGDDVAFRRLDAGAFAFLHTLTSTTRLDGAADAALEIDPTIDLALMIRSILDDDILVPASSS